MKGKRFKPSEFYRVYRRGEYPKPRKHLYLNEFPVRGKAYRFAYNRWREGERGLVIVHPDGNEEHLTFGKAPYMCPVCASFRIGPCDRGGYRCAECGSTFGAD